MKNKVEFDVRVYPLDDEDSATKAFASVAITVNGEKLAAIRNVRVVDGVNGVFVSMPQTKTEKDGQPPTYHDIAYGKGDVKTALNTAVLAEYAKTKSPAYRPPQNEQGDGAAVEPSQASGNIKLVAFVTPLKGAEGSLKAFANVLFKCEGEDLIAINGIRVVDGQKGTFVQMPQQRRVSQEDREVTYHAVAFPLTKGLNDALSKAVLAEYARSTSERKVSFGERLEEGKEKSARAAAERPAPAQEAAKRGPGVRD